MPAASMSQIDGSGTADRSTAVNDVTYPESDCPVPPGEPKVMKEIVALVASAKGGGAPGFNAMPAGYVIDMEAMSTKNWLPKMLE